MKKNNFRDPETGEEIYINHFKIKIGADGRVSYQDGDNKPIINSNGIPLEFIEKEVPNGGYSVHIGKFASMTPSQRAEMLKKRAAEDNEKHRDKWHQMNSKDYMP